MIFFLGLIIILSNKQLFKYQFGQQNNKKYYIGKDRQSPSNIICNLLLEKINGGVRDKLTVLANMII